MAIRPSDISTSMRPAGFSRYEDATDAQLLTLMQAGDDRALEMVLRRYRGIIWKVAKSYLGSLNEAEDIFQEISLTLHKNRTAYQSGSAKFSSWLYRVTVNKCLDVLKSSGRKTAHIELKDTIPSASPTAEDTIHQDQLASQLKEMLAILPRQQRLALSLHYYENLQVSEISSCLDISELAVRSLLKRGKAKLREMSALEI